MKRLLLICLFPLSTWAQGSSSISTGSAETLSSNSNISYKLESSYFQSSNALKTQEAKASPYVLVKPQVGFERLGESGAFSSSLEASYKKLADAELDSLAGERKIDLKNSLLWLASDSSEFAVDLNLSLSDVDSFYLTADSKSAPENQKSKAADLRLAHTLRINKYAFETAANISTKNYDTVTHDRGLTYLNSYSRSGIELNNHYDLNESMKASLKYSLDQRKYSGKPADFSDGNPSVFDNLNPNAQETSQDLSLQLESQILRHKLKMSSGYRFTKDQIFAAKDAKGPMLQLSWDWQISKSIKLIQALSYSQSQFANFKSDPSDINSDVRRQDTDSKLSIISEIKASKNIQLLLQYGQMQKKTNYALGTSFNDDSIGIGLRFEEGSL